MVEMAVFGAIALAALGFLIRVGLRMNYEQEIRMAAFRRALHAAHSDDARHGTPGQDAVGVLYHYIAHRQLPDVEDGFAAMPRVRTEADAFVIWGDNLTFAHSDDDPATLEGRNTQERIVVRSDDSVIDLRAEDFPTDATAPFASTATRGLIKRGGAGDPSWTLANTSSSCDGGLVQRHHGAGDVTTSVCTTTSTSATTRLNTIGGAPDSISSGMSSTNRHDFNAHFDEWIR
jgi:hypothetical protein